MGADKQAALEQLASATANLARIDKALAGKLENVVSQHEAAQRRAERPHLDNVELVAVRMGEYPKGTIRNTGEKFVYSGVQPSWAVAPKNFKPEKPKPVGGDLKSKAAQAAVRAKAGALSGVDGDLA